MDDDEIDYTSYLPDILRAAKEGNDIKMCLLKKTYSKNDQKKRRYILKDTEPEQPRIIGILEIKQFPGYRILSTLSKRQELIKFVCL